MFMNVVHEKKKDFFVRKLLKIFQFMKVEEEVRRKVKTASVAGGVMQGYEKAAERGFQLLPPEVSVQD